MYEHCWRGEETEFDVAKFLKEKDVLDEFQLNVASSKCPICKEYYGAHSSNCPNILDISTDALDC